ncbi:MAG: flagellar biosynthetic protein FliO [Pseudomonadales bacterium]|nr:flagellar biosynthetic protein FliO [Pseudomonadales bacterium]
MLKATLRCFRAAVAVSLGLACFSVFGADYGADKGAVKNTDAPALQASVSSKAIGISELPVSKSPAFEVSKAATSSGVSTSQYLNLILGLVVILGFIFLVAWLLRRVGGIAPTSASAMKIVGGLTLGGRDRVVLLQVGEKQILLSASPGNISLIYAFDEAPIENISTSTGSDFYHKLQASLSRSSASSKAKNTEAKDTGNELARATQS